LVLTDERPSNERVLALYETDKWTYEQLGGLFNPALNVNQIAGMIYQARRARNGDNGSAPKPSELTGPFAPPTRQTKSYPHVGLRAAVFDIETTDFNSTGYAGFFVAGCILDIHTGEPRVFAIDYEKRGKDKHVVLDFVDALCEYDILIGHNIAAFDLNWLHSRFMYYNLPWPRAWLCFDTYQAAKALAIKSFKSLGMLADYFCITSAEKTSVLPRAWHNIRSDDRAEFDEAQQSIVYHNVEDCILNRQVFDALFPFAMSLPASPFKISKWRTGAHHSV
jgi:hypothetical protein